MSDEQRAQEAALQLKLLEVKSQQEKLKSLQSDLEKLNSKINQHEKLSPEDTKFISNLGWLSALSITVASIVAGV